MSTSSCSAGSKNETDFQKKLLELARLTENLLNQMENGEFRCRRQLEEIDRIRGGDSRKFHSWDSTLNTMEHRKKPEKTTRCCLSKQQGSSSSPRYEPCRSPFPQVTAKRSQAGANNDFESSLYCPPKSGAEESEYVGCCSKKKKSGQLPVVPMVRHYPSGSSNKGSLCSDKECTCKKNVQRAHDELTLVSLTQSQEMSREFVEICPDKITAAQEKVIVVHSFEAANTTKERHGGAPHASRSCEREREKSRCPPYGDCRNRPPGSSGQQRESQGRTSEMQRKKNESSSKGIKPVESLTSSKSRIMQLERLKNKSHQHPTADEVAIYWPPPVSTAEGRSEQKREDIKHSHREYAERPKDWKDTRNWEEPVRLSKHREKYDYYKEKLGRSCHCPSPSDFDRYARQIQPASSREYVPGDEQAYRKLPQKKPVKSSERDRPLEGRESPISISCYSDEFEPYPRAHRKRSTSKKRPYQGSEYDKNFRDLQDRCSRDYPRPSQKKQKGEIQSSRNYRNIESSEESQDLHEVPAVLSNPDSICTLCHGIRYRDNNRVGRKRPQETCPDADFRTSKGVPRKVYQERSTERKIKKKFSPPQESEETESADDFRQIQDVGTPQDTVELYRGGKVRPRSEKRCCKCGVAKPFEEFEPVKKHRDHRRAKKSVSRKAPRIPPNQCPSQPQAKNRQSWGIECGSNFEGVPICCKCGLLKPIKASEPTQKIKQIKPKTFEAVELPEAIISEDDNYLINQYEAQCKCYCGERGQTLTRKHQASAKSPKLHDPTNTKRPYRASSCPSDIPICCKNPGKKSMPSKRTTSRKYREIDCQYFKPDAPASCSDSKIDRGSKKSRSQSAHTSKNQTKYAESSSKRRPKDNNHSDREELICECKDEIIPKVVKPEIEKKKPTSDTEVCYCGKNFCRMEPGRKSRDRKSSSHTAGSKQIGTQQIVGSVAFSESKTFAESQTFARSQGVAISQAFVGSQTFTASLQVPGRHSVAGSQQRRSASLAGTQLVDTSLSASKPPALPAIEPPRIDQHSEFSQADGSQQIDEMLQRSQEATAELDSTYSSCTSQLSGSYQTTQDQSACSSTKPQEPSLRDSGAYSPRSSGKNQVSRLSDKSYKSQYLSRLSEKSEDILQDSPPPVIAPPPSKNRESARSSADQASRVCCKCGKETCPNAPEKICGKNSPDETENRCKCEKRKARKSAGKSESYSCMSSDKKPEQRPERRRTSTVSQWTDPNQVQKLLAPIPPRRSTSESGSIKSMSLTKDPDE
ncbi:unnamed protein product [Hermetia illucens]|uniref:Uncharacterized protein n=1 Tax=Hermetia illucens TaxID=343691 RepID=A0A7R8YZW3_HERIL|nr:uncharacterized protein LOC119660592 [Hermetia illucens]CAD7092004.1 unnamed protein product [Hermetia illucens]